ncbi:TfoX/Sxy family protein [Flavobacterium sp. UMI-01]|uniref:TfoX/Sxy family protein n=1 Tax=Flavobacterium sp. UMI-01 TaxID=1441053 RepID=UPI001C7D0F43|nr:TfoX/Sxy family protein [Flavobacterium sp. UMI-01]GIZ07681.1 RNA methyltransferase [Flavobacterium sp. UMI-01]
MAYNELLSLRIQQQLQEQQMNFVEKKMFGGIAFMIADKMCIGVMKELIMLRVMDEYYDGLLRENHVRPMTFTGKRLKNFLYIESEAFATEKQLARWVVLAIDFGKRGVVKSKKKK